MSMSWGAPKKKIGLQQTPAARTRNPFAQRPILTPVLQQIRPGVRPNPLLKPRPASIRGTVTRPTGVVSGTPTAYNQVQNVLDPSISGIEYGPAGAANWEFQNYAQEGLDTIGTGDEMIAEAPSFFQQYKWFIFGAVALGAVGLIYYQQNGGKMETATKKIGES